MLPELKPADFGLKGIILGSTFYLSDVNNLKDACSYDAVLNPDT